MKNFRKVLSKTFGKGLSRNFGKVPSNEGYALHTLYLIKRGFAL